MSHYEVQYCVHVDHPELRDESFSRRDEHKSASSQRFETQGAAVCFFNEIVAGNWDYGSEYMCWVQVHEVRPGKAPRCVRKRVDRERSARWVYDHNPAPEGTSAWSLTDGTPAIYCKRCKLWLADGVSCKHIDQEELEAWLALGEKGREALAERDAA